jgi:CRP/FNR family transcriptional regulator
MNRIDKAAPNSAHGAADNPHLSFLYSHNILSRLPAVWLERLQQGARRISIEEGEALFSRGDPADGCYWLRRGIVKVSVTSNRGEERILAFLGQGALLGEPALFDAKPRAVNVYAVTACHLEQIGRPALKSLLREHPEAYDHLLVSLTAEIRQVGEEAVVATFLTVAGRVARVLHKLAAHLGRDLSDARTEIGYAVRHSDIAAMAGVARESVSRLLSEWRREGLVAVSRDGKLVVRKAQLAQQVLREA